MNDLRRRLRARWARAAGPVIPITVFGAAWIARHAAAGRGSTRTLFQSAALAESVVALLLRGRKPAGLLAVYALTGLGTLMILPVLLVVATIADRRRRRTAAAATLAAAAVVAGTPFLHSGRSGILAVTTLPGVAAVVLAAVLGAWVRAHRHPAILGAGPGGTLVAAT